MSNDFGSSNQEENVDYRAYFQTSEVFHKEKELFAWCNSIASELSFVLNTSGPKAVSRRSTRMSVYYYCHRGGPCRSKLKDMVDALRRKNTKSKKMHCPFSLKGVQLGKVGDIPETWALLTREDEFSYHHHPMTAYNDGHQRLSGLDEAEKRFVTEQVKALLPRQKLSRDCIYKPRPVKRQIYNLAYKGLKRRVTVTQRNKCCD